MTIVRMVRHGRAAAGWDTEVDPGLDALGITQAVTVAEGLRDLGPLLIATSPLRRCRETAAPLAAAWGVDAEVHAAVAEIPSPPGVPMGERVAWLRLAMSGEWSSLGERYTAYRDAVGTWVGGRRDDVVVFSHFVAINAAIGVATGDDRLVIASLDNASVTTFEVDDAGSIRLVEVGAEADTLIR